VDGSNNTYDLLCGANGGAGPQANSDIITIRRASVNPVPPLAGAMQIQTTRLNGELFADGNVPVEFSTDINPNTGEPYSTTHNLIINSYYVAADSDLIPGVSESALPARSSSTRKSRRASRTSRSSLVSTSTRTTRWTVT
jgi:hypothetical protein